MKTFIKGAFREYTRDMITIITLSVFNSLANGVSILLLIPMLNIVNISSSDIGIFSFAITLFSNLTYSIRVAVLLIVYIMVMLTTSLLSRYMSIYNTKFVQKYVKRLRLKVYNSVIDADWEIFTAQKHNDLLNSFTNETSNISSAMTIFPTIVSIVITAITQLSIAFALNIPLTLIVLVFGSIFFLIFKKYFAIAKLNGERMRIANRQYLDEIKNQLDSIKEIKSYGVEEFHKKLLHDVLDEYETASIRRTKMATLPTLLFSMSSTILITIIFYIANVILQVEIMELILIVYIFARIWPIFSRLHKEMFSLNNAIPSFENVDRMLRTLNATSAEKEASEGHIDIKREIAFDSVSFAYSGTTEKILDTTTFSIKAHTITALKGESGVGKSTIVDLLMGLLRPSEGRILFDDTVLDHQNIRAWRRSIGYMPQDPIILNKSIRENITRFNPHVSEEEIILALKNSQAFDFVQKLPDGLDTLMGNKGIRLSGGEKQRIALARVLVSSPSILILDEATSALDNENDRKIQEIIQSLKQSMTIVIVAHRISTIESADHVMNVKNGQVYSV